CAVLRGGDDGDIISLPDPPDVAVVCLDVNPWEMGKNYAVDVAILGDPKATLSEMAPMIGQLMSETSRQTAAQRAETLGRAKAEAQQRLRAQAAEETSKTPMPALAMNYVIATTVPEDICIVDESLTSDVALRNLLPRRHPRDYFGLKGGGIGWGLPATVGVSLARRDQPVLGLIGDGSAMYNIQALWTAARYGLRSIFVICNNGQYLILKRRLHAYDGPAAKAQEYVGIDLVNPAIRFVNLANSLGVHGVRAEGATDFQQALKEALQRPGPTLIDVAIEADFPTA
ncbi:thiamine pyrophosphate-dependent enzyme, partial [Candidatus Entotheonella palauensis]